MRIEITSGSVGKWSVRVDEKASKNIHKTGEDMHWQVMKDGVGENEYGNFDRTEEF